MGARQDSPGSLAARVTYLLESENWLIATVVLGWKLPLKLETALEVCRTYFAIQAAAGGGYACPIGR